jgi:hypothetical protein
MRGREEPTERPDLPEAAVPTEREVNTVYKIASTPDAVNQFQQNIRSSPIEKHPSRERRGAIISRRTPRSLITVFQSSPPREEGCYLLLPLGEVILVLLSILTPP